MHLHIHSALMGVGLAWALSGCAHMDRPTPLVTIFEYRDAMARERKTMPEWDTANRAYRFDGRTTSFWLTNDLPARIGTQDFSVSMEIRPSLQPGDTAYLLEHHLAFPWTGLFLCIENNQRLRFRVKDLPHCDVVGDIRELIGDGRFHHVVVTRAAATLSIYLDGELLVSRETPELVDLDIGYKERPTVGRHCEFESNYYAGWLRGLQFDVGHCMTAKEVAAQARRLGFQRGNSRT